MSFIANNVNVCIFEEGDGKRRELLRRIFINGVIFKIMEDWMISKIVSRMKKEGFDDHYVYDAGIVDGYQYIRIRLRIPWTPVRKLGLPIVFKINLKTRRMYKVLNFWERMEACDRHTYTPMDFPEIKISPRSKRKPLSAATLKEENPNP